MNSKDIKISIFMGSSSDQPVMEEGQRLLDDFGIGYEVNVSSAHRMPKKTRDLVKNLEEKGVEVVIAGAGKAAHLPGVIASYTRLPVIGIPVKTSDLGGLDSLLSIVQMPPGVPVATVAINGAKNAALLAVQILALKYDDIKQKFIDYKKRMEES